MKTFLLAIILSLVLCGSAWAGSGGEFDYGDFACFSWGGCGGGPSTVYGFYITSDDYYYVTSDGYRLTAK